MKKILLLLFCIPLIAMAQENLLIEDFNYQDGNLVTQGGWAPTGTTTTNPLQLSNNNTLTMNSYLTGVKLLTLTNTGQDANKIISDVNSGSLYASFLINVSAAQTAGDYFFNFGDGGTSNFYARLFARSSGSGFNLGISKSSVNTTILPVYGSTEYVYGTTYLIVIKYIFNASSTDDICSVFVNSDLTSTSENGEIASHSNSTQADFATIKSVNIRQGSSSSAPTLTLTSLKVGTTWSTSVLPITLSDFSGKKVDETILLNWSTRSEENNDYFEIKHSTDGKKFSSIGNVNGACNSSNLINYSFTDINPAAGTNYYQLIQHDFDGKTSASKIIALDAKIAKAQLSVYTQSGNININISSPNQSKGQLQLLDILGRKIADQTIEVNKGYNLFSLSANTHPGIHFVKYTSDEASIFQKFLIN